jgi:ubiquinone/menaquinone biosynthesis C-methylase UbiE
VSDIVAAGYDVVYAAMPRSPTLWRVWKQHAAGADFPDELSHISFVTVAELERIAGELRLSTGQTLIDLGCGLAGPALWTARRTDARLGGVDVSQVAVLEATKRAEALGLGGRASFAVGSFDATTLPEASADAVMSEDALQYAPDKRAAFAEAARITKPDGRFAFTAFELEPAAVADLPVLGVDPTDDYRPPLEDAGFAIETYEEVSGWPEPVSSAYQAVLDAREQLVAEMGETAVAAMTSEMSMTLERRPYRRRVLAVARLR